MVAPSPTLHRAVVEHMVRQAVYQRLGKDALAYHPNRSANCIILGSAADVMRMKLALLIVFVGSPKFAWFNVLNTSNRNCALSRSCSWKSLCSPESQTTRDGPVYVFRPRNP